MFEFLLKHRFSSPEEERRVVGSTPYPGISFYAVSDSKLAEAERRLGFTFPNQLRTLYSKIGYGFIDKSPITGKSAVQNYVVPPTLVAELMALSDPPPLPVPDYGAPRNGFPEGCLPFLDMGDGSFLYLKPQSDNPNAVWGVRGDKLICNDLVEFFARLYEDPWFPVRVEFPGSFDESGQVRGMTR
jgi:hypothetical protein